MMTDQTNDRAVEAAKKIIKNGHINETWHLLNMSRIMAKLDMDNKAAPMGSAPELAIVSMGEHIHTADECRYALTADITAIIRSVYGGWFDRDKEPVSGILRAERLNIAAEILGIIPTELADRLIRPTPEATESVGDDKDNRFLDYIDEDQPDFPISEAVERWGCSCGYQNLDVEAIKFCPNCGKGKYEAPADQSKCPWPENWKGLFKSISFGVTYQIIDGRGAPILMGLEENVATYLCRLLNDAWKAGK